MGKGLGAGSGRAGANGEPPAEVDRAPSAGALGPLADDPLDILEMLAGHVRTAAGPHLVADTTVIVAYLLDAVYLGVGRLRLAPPAWMPAGARDLRGLAAELRDAR